MDLGNHEINQGSYELACLIAGGEAWARRNWLAQSLGKVMQIPKWAGALGFGFPGGSVDPEEKREQVWM